MKCLNFSICFLITLKTLEGRVNFSNVDIPREHMPFFFYNFPHVAEECANENDCPFKVRVPLPLFEND